MFTNIKTYKKINWNNKKHTQKDTFIEIQTIEQDLPFLSNNQ